MHHREPCQQQLAPSADINAAWVAKRGHTTSTTGNPCTSRFAQPSMPDKNSAAHVTTPLPMRRLRALSS